MHSQPKSSTASTSRRSVNVKSHAVASESESDSGSASDKEQDGDEPDEDADGEDGSKDNDGDLEYLEKNPAALEALFTHDNMLTSGCC